jgi:hypothetical protein
MISNQLKNKILEKATTLEKFGMRDLVWEKEEAKKLISSLMADEIGILGGDVYQIILNNLRPTYDNWSCEPRNGETKDDYFFRSKKSAFDYIEGYPVKEGEKVLFSLVFTEILD